MTLRTTALIAGALGLLLLIGGLIADAMRPAAFGTPSAPLDAPVLIIGPEMVALAPGGSITVEGQGEILAYSARDQDATDWAATRDAAVLTGVTTWEELAVDTFVAPSPSASPTASASASATASPAASPSASPSPSAQASSTPAVADIWRDTWEGDGSVTFTTDDTPVGLTLVVETADGAPLSAVSMQIDRVVNDGWVTPLKWWGGILAVGGLIALISLLIDHRGAGSKVEAAVAGRKPAQPAVPGGRRERREALTATSGIPVVAAADDPTTGEVPRVDLAQDDAPADGEPDNPATSGEERS